MYTKKIECKSGIVKVTYTDGNIPIKAESATHIARNAMGLRSEELHEIYDTAGGIVQYQMQDA